MAGFGDLRAYEAVQKSRYSTDVMPLAGTSRSTSTRTRPSVIPVTSGNIAGTRLPPAADVIDKSKAPPGPVVAPSIPTLDPVAALEFLTNAMKQYGGGITSLTQMPGISGMEQETPNFSRYITSAKTVPTGYHRPNEQMLKLWFDALARYQQGLGG